MFATNTRVLIVDDMKSMRLIVKGALSKLGFTDVTEASGGNEAFQLIEAAAAEGRPYGLVISDWNMPSGTGIECLRRTRQAYGKLPYLMVTAEAEVGQITEAVTLGVSDYLIKPFTPESLAKKIESVYAKHFGAGATKAA